MLYNAGNVSQTPSARECCVSVNLTWERVASIVGKSSLDRSSTSDIKAGVISLGTRLGKRSCVKRNRNGVIQQNMFSILFTIVPFVTHTEWDKAGKLHYN